jgi:hypothetical protein
MASIRRGRARTLIIVGGSVAAITLWWFLRNYDLYADFTGRDGVTRTGVSFPASDFTLRNVGEWGRGVFAYLWTPAEYYRNLINTPRWYEAASAALFLVAAVGSVRARALSRAGVSLAFVATVLLSSLALIYFTQSSVAGRLLYPLCSLYAFALTRGFRSFGERTGAMLVSLTLLAYTGYSLVVLADVNDALGLIHFN